MLLAEALSNRKTLLKEITALTQAIEENSFYYEDEGKASVEDVNKLLKELSGKYDNLQRLNVDINITNQVVQITFEKSEMTLMQAIALRDRLHAEARALAALLESISLGMGRRQDRYGLRSGRSKEDVKRVATLKVTDVRARHDKVAERIRLLDTEIQKANWSNELAVI